jgi:hypothetical protein
LNILEEIGEKEAKKERQGEREREREGGKEKKKIDIEKLRDNPEHHWKEK